MFEHRPNGGGTSEIVTLVLVLVIIAMHRLRFVSIPSDELFLLFQQGDREREEDEDEKLCFVSSSLSIRFEQRNPTIKRSKSIFVYFSDFFSLVFWAKREISETKILCRRLKYEWDLLFVHSL